MSEQVRANKRRSALLTLGFVVVLVVIGLVIGAITGNLAAGAVVGVLCAVLVAALAFWQGDRIALRVSRARVASVEEFPRLHNVVDGLCVASGQPKPGVYVIDDAAPNALATGRDPAHASIAVTTGLLDTLDLVELEGVIAHQLSQIRHSASLLSTLAVVLIGGVPLIGDLALRTRWWNGGRVARPGDPSSAGNPVAYVGVALSIVAPIAGWAMRATIPPQRVTLADISACQLTRYPPAMIAALEKLRADTTVTHSATTATAHLWAAQPMSGVGDDGELARLHRMFDTHPPLDERIALLEEL